MLDYKEELATKLNMLLLEIGNPQYRDALDVILRDYEISRVSTALVTTHDIQEKLEIFLACKKLQSVGEATLRNYAREIISFSRYTPKPLQEVTPMDIRRYMTTYHEKYKPSTANHKISVIKNFFGWLSSEGYISGDPTLNIKDQRVGKRLRKALTTEQLENIRSKCDSPRESAILEFLYSTGCRVSEVSGVDIGDINFNEGSLRVIGKGDKERMVYITIRAKVALKKYLNTRTDDNPSLFVSQRGCNRLGSATFQRTIKKMASRCDIHAYPHLIRHTFATHAVNMGMPLSVVQQLLGHENPATTLIYAELSQSTISKEYAKLG